MKDHIKVSKAVIKRLPKYRRYLEELKGQGADRISSGEFSKLIGYTASQIRQDLNNFGGFGQQGYGYNVESLHRQIGIILGIDRAYSIVIVGSGNLGQAIANYIHNYETGFSILAMFDVKPEIIGRRVNNVEILNFDALDAYLKAQLPDIGVITTGATSAQSAANKLTAGGVKGIWNFAPVDLNVPDSVALENVHLSDSLHALTYYLNSLQ
ncbi:MAG: redox-sensing transcriptional repressor Rex [Clostridiales Family XIII bacterium]|jgi:redox-sensing transcriptional repressor|nr:redox-sensing transcriptional repressor Rex [Clostridiales Family XIII bacterium]